MDGFIIQITYLKGGMFMKRIKSIILVAIIMLNIIAFDNYTASGATVLDQPTITSPSDGDFLELGRITVRWDSVSGADYYKIAVLDMTTESKIIDNEIVNGTRYKISSSNLQEGHKYKVALGAYGNDGSESYWCYSYFSIKESEITQLDTPVISSPSDGASLDLGKVTVSWNSVHGADYYKIAVLDTTTGTKFIDNEKVTSTSYKILSSYLEEGHSYKIALGAYRNDGSESYWASSFFSINLPTTTGSINITSLSSGMLFNVGSQIPLRGSVTGKGYSYTKFFVKVNPNSSDYIYGNNELSGSSPSDTWDTTEMKAGTYYIYAVLYGNNGVELDKQNVSVTLKSVQATGSINITSPTSGTSYTVGTKIPLRGSVTGTGYSYSKFFVKTDPNSSDYIYGNNELSGSSPLDTWDTTGLQAGTYYIYCVVYGNSGEELDKKNVSITLKDVPIPTMSSFNLNKTIITIGDTISFTGTIYSNGGTVEKVTINIQGPNNRSATSEYISNYPTTASFNMNAITSIKTGDIWMKEPGEYWIEVWAKNKGGSSAKVAEKEVTLEANITLPNIITQSASNIGATNAELNGLLEKDGGITVTDCGFYWGTSSGYLINKISVSTKSKGSIISKLQGLTANKTYYFKAYAVNSRGEATGVIQSFTTLVSSDPTITMEVNNNKDNIYTKGDTITIKGNGKNCDHVALEVNGNVVDGSIQKGNTYKFVYKFTKTGKHVFKLKARNGIESDKNSIVTYSNEKELTVTLKIKGIVYRKYTDKKLAVGNAKVMLNNDPNFRTTTDYTGRFSFNSVMPGSEMSIEKEGYEKIEHIQITENSDITNIINELTYIDSKNVHTIKGRVLNKYSENGIPGVYVEVVEKDSTFHWSATTDENGYYKIDGVGPDIQGVNFSKSGFVDSDGKSTATYSIYSGLYNDLTVPVIQLIDMNNKYIISGRITEKNNPNKPIVGSVVKIVGQEKFYDTTDKDGYYKIYGVGSNSWIIEANCTNYIPATARANVNSKNIIVNLQMQKPVIIEGTVYEGYFVGTRSDTPINNAKVWLNDGEGYTVLPPLKNGFFQFTNVAPVPHILRVECSGYLMKETLEATYHKNINVTEKNKIFDIELVNKENIPSYDYQQIVKDAFNSGLLTNRTRMSFSNNITRSEFTELVGKLFVKLGGKTSDITNITNYNTYKDDNKPINRQEIAVILFNMLKKLYPGLYAETSKLAFSDSTNIEIYAKEAIAFFTENGIINSTASNMYNPEGSVLKEDAIKIILNVYNKRSSFKANDKNLNNTKETVILSKVNQLRQIQLSNNAIKEMVIPRPTNFIKENFSINAKVLSNVKYITLYCDDTQIQDFTLEDSKTQKNFNIFIKAKESGIKNIQLFAFDKNKKLVGKANKYIHAHEDTDYVVAHNISVKEFGKDKVQVQFTAFNSKASIATVETFDGKGNLIDVIQIDPVKLPDSLSGNLLNMIKAGTYGLVWDTIIQQNLGSRISSTNTVTTDVNFTIPKGGSFKLCQSYTDSEYVFLFNVFDLAFKSFAVCDDINNTNSKVIKLKSFAERATEASYLYYARELLKDEGSKILINNLKECFNQERFKNLDDISFIANEIMDEFQKSNINFFDIVINGASKSSPELGKILSEIISASVDTTVSTGEDLMLATYAMPALVSKRIMIPISDALEILCQYVSLQQLRKVKSISYTINKY